MNVRRLIVMILTVCMIVTYMPITGYVYADETDNDQETGSEAIEFADVSMPTNNGSDDPADIPDTEEKAAIRALSGEAQREALDEYLDSETAENDIIEAESGLDFNTYDLGENTRAKVFFSYPVRYEDDNGDFMEIEPELVALDSKSSAKGSSFKDYGYENKAGEYKTYIPSVLSSDTPILLENDKYTFTMAPAVFNSNDAQVSVEDVKATYGSDEDDIKLEYISQNDGIKENIILNERPTSNEITFKLTFDNMSYSMNPTDHGITFYDEETDDIVMGIESPFMNDATGEAYSEDLEYEMIDPEEGDDTYTLKLKISDKYLDDPDRVYPVTIDPTATWVGTSEVRDSYVISGFPTTNFYSTSTVVMPSGSGTQGVHRTYIHILNLKSELIGANISSASFDIYETGGGNSGKNVRVYRITEDWTNSTVTWNNKPDIASGFIDSIATNGTANHKMSYDVTSWVSNVVNESVHNYGLCLRNKTESGTTYSEFYGTRTGATSYRPKLTVVYTEDKPTQATSVTTTNPNKKGNYVKVTWAGVTANKLDYIQYKIAKCDENGTVTDASFVPYTSLGTSLSSGTKTIPGSDEFPGGYYRVYIRGVSKMGTVGNYESKRFRIEGKPKLPSAVTVSPSTIYNGDSITVSWTGLKLPNDVKAAKAQYRVAEIGSDGKVKNWNIVPYKVLKSEPDINGNKTVTLKIDDGILQNSTGNFKIFVRGVNSFDETGTGRGSNVFSILRDTSPAIGGITVLKGNDEVSSDTYITPGDLTVNVTGITDDQSLSGRTGTYTLKRGEETIRSGSASLTESSGTYSAAFTINSSDISVTGDYVLNFSVTDARENTSKKIKNFKVDNTDPIGTIEFTDYLQEDMIGITANISDEGSGIDDASLDLYSVGNNNERTFVGNLADNFTISKHIDLNTLHYPNGSYQLELNVTDKAGNSITVTEDFEIESLLEVLECELTVLDDDTIRVNWEYTGERTDLSKIRYSVNGGTAADINVTGTSGYFDVLITDTAESGYIVISGVDANNIVGRSVRKDFTMDLIPLYVNIASITRGLVTGSVTDDDLMKWEIFIKQSNASNDSYVKLTEGTNIIDNGMICTLDLDSTYQSGTYTVKLKASDNKGNAEECTYTYSHSQAGSHIVKTAAQVRIKRELDQDRTLNTFILPSSATLITLETPSNAVSGKWYVDNAKVSDSLTYQANFSTYQENVAKNIIFIGLDANGNKVLSSDLYKDRIQTSGTWGLLDVEMEDDITFSDNVTAFNINFTEKPGVSYYVKAGNGSYVDLYPNTLIYVSDLDQNIFETDTITVKAETDDTARLGSYTAYGASVDKEYFKVSSAEEYYPSDFRAVDKINYKTYLSWDVPSNLPNDVTYEVYRSTERNFIPGDNTLLADGIRDGYFVDINVSYGQDFWYRVRAVKEGSLLHPAEYSSFTKTKRSRAIDEDEYTKELGIRDHLSYTNVTTPKGTGYIEKSKGNFAYVTTDAVIPNELLPVELSRTYNSESTSKSILGYGWTMGYDMEILKLVDKNNADNGIMALRDTDGSIYTFKAAEQGQYITELGRYLKLEETANTSREVTINGDTEVISYSYVMRTREGVRYLFDSFGRLAVTEEANGHFVISRYDPDSGLLSEIVTDKGLSVSLVYNDAGAGSDAYTVKELVLPDGSRIAYSYDDSYLTNAEYIPYGETTGISEGYSYVTSGSVTRLNELHDGEDNEYDISYGQDSVTFTYPGTSNREGVIVRYGDGYSITDSLIGETVVSREYDDIEGSQVVGTVIMGDGDIHEVTSGEERDVTYGYTDGLLVSETERIYYSILPEGMTGDIRTSVKEDRETYSYADDLLTGSSGTVLGVSSGSEVTYSERGEWNSYLPASVEETAGDRTLADERFEYDAEGNVIEHFDLVSHRYTSFSYYGDDQDDDPRFKGRVKTRTDKLLEGENPGDIVSTTTVELLYDNSGNKEETVSVTKGGNVSEAYTKYDPMGRLIFKVISTEGSDENTRNVTETSYSYDGYGRVTEETERTYFKDSLTGSISGIRANRTEKTYDRNSTVASETFSHYEQTSARTGFVTDQTISYTYDSLNRLIITETKDAGETVISRNRTDYSFVSDLNVNDGMGGRTIPKALRVREYEGTGDGTLTGTSYSDGLGRTVRNIDRNGVICDYGYDRNGEPITEYLYTNDQMDEGLLTLTCFNEEGDETAVVVDPGWDGSTFTVPEDSVFTKTSYDVNGNMTSQTDALGNITEYVYDEEDRVTSVSLPDTDNMTTFSYSEAVDEDDDNYTETVLMTDAMDHSREEVLDEDGNTIRVSDLGSGSGVTPIVTEFRYDGDGNLLSELHSEGDHLDFIYDSRGRLTEKKEYDSGDTEVQRTVYTYFDENDRVESMSDYTVSNGITTLYHYEKYSYDDLGRMSSKAEYQGTEVPADLSPYTLNYYYDSHDNITSITYGSAIPSEVDAVDYVYSGDRLSQIKVKVGNTGYTVKEYTYTAWGAVKTVKDYYDFKTSGTTKYIILDYTYNDLLNLSEMVYTKEDETVLERHSYVYDKAGKIIAEENSSSLNDLNEIRRYQYDTLGRLVLSDIKDIEEVTEEGETEVSEENKVTTAYSYDKVGNRLSKIENGVETVYEYNGLDQLTSENTDGDITEYTYDLNGNQTEATSEVDGQNITRAFTYTPSGMMETYSEDNTLMQTNTYSGEGERIRKVEGANVTNYFYQEGSVLYTTGSGSSFNLVNYSDIFGTVRNTDDYYFYLEDIHGSTTNLIDDTAGQVASYWYNDFGEVTEEKGTGYIDFINEIQYTGAIYDDTTSLLYLNARFYDPSTGRFISQDTYRGEYEEPDTWHLYAYCANDPVNFVDPSGHRKVREKLTKAMVDALINNTVTKALFLEIRAIVSASSSAFLTAKGYILSRKMFNNNIWRGGKKLKKGVQKLLEKTLRNSKQIINKVKNMVKKKKHQDSYSFSSSDGDLFYAIGKCSIELKDKIQAGRKKYRVKIWDIYDFTERVELNLRLSNLAINLGYYLERAGVTHPYDWEANIVVTI